MLTIMDSPCGPRAPCRAQLEAMVKAHCRALQELQEKHEQELRQLEEQKDQLMRLEIQSSEKGNVQLYKKRSSSLQ